MFPLVLLRHRLKPVLKRGCLVAAANWPVTLIQSAADSLFKLLLAVPLVGGIFLVALVVGAEPGLLFADLISWDGGGLSVEWRQLAATLVASLMSHPLVLSLFLLSIGTVGIGGSLFVFLVKGGTVGVLVRGDAKAAPLELPPLQFEVVASASAFTIEAFTESAQRLFPRYARLGAVLLGTYAATGVVYLLALYATRTAVESWSLAALLTLGIVSWITFVNSAYLLVQVVIATDDCGVRAGISRTVAFVRHELRAVAGVFAVVLAMAIFATGASFLAAASLGVLTFVPMIGFFFWLAALPLQLLAWMFRQIVFQYIGLSSVGAYLRLYRDFNASAARLPASLPDSRVLASDIP